jgi:hypothetical protein
MQPLELNLAPRPFRNNTLLWSGLAVAVLLLGWFTWWNVQTYQGNADELAELRDKVDGFDQRMTQFQLRDGKARAAIDRYDLSELAVQAAKANDVIEWKAFSWTRLFNHLEDLQPYKVKMLAVRPVFYAAERKTQNETVPEGAVPVQVEGIAENLRWFLAFERALLQDPHFSEVEPERSNKLESGEIRFDLKFLYYPGQEPGHEQVEIPEVAPDRIANPKIFRQVSEEQRAAMNVATDDEGGGEEPEEEPEDQTGGSTGGAADGVAAESEPDSRDGAAVVSPTPTQPAAGAREPVRKQEEAE